MPMCALIYYNSCPPTVSLIPDTGSLRVRIGSVG
jgi:hypothetical protein